MTMLVPFVVFGKCGSVSQLVLPGFARRGLTIVICQNTVGVGLDDTFIITSAFSRTRQGKSIEERIRDTMEDVGLSITVTTVTTAFAFGLVRERSSICILCLLSNL